MFFTQIDEPSHPGNPPQAAIAISNPGAVRQAAQSGLHYPELTVVARFAESIFNTAAHALDHDRHVMFGGDAASHLDTPKGALFGFSFTDHGKGDREYRLFVVTVFVSLLRVHPQSN